MKLQEVKLCFSSAGVNTDWLAWSALTQASSGTWCLLALPEAQIINSFFFSIFFSSTFDLLYSKAAMYLSYLELDW